MMWHVMPREIFKIKKMKNLAKFLTHNTLYERNDMFTEVNSRVSADVRNAFTAAAGRVTKIGFSHKTTTDFKETLKPKQAI